MSESGKTILGQYTLLKLIGKGGSGEVYHAKQEGLDRAVALKVFYSDLGLEPAEFETFKNRVMNYLGMSHGNLVRAIDCGIEQGRSVLALEPIEGMNFRKCIEQAGPFIPAFAIPVLQGVAQGLVTLHEGGVVHGALTSGNVMFTKSGDVLLMDFPPGIRDATSMVSRLKRAPTNVVTIAPEIAQGKPPTTATDVFAFGVFAYQLLTQKQPYQVSNAKEWLRAVQESDPIPPAEFGIELSDGLAAFVLGCLDRDPANRHTAKDLVEVLEYITLESGLDGADLSIDMLKKSSLRMSKKTSMPGRRPLKPSPVARKIVPVPAAGAGGVMDRLKVWHLLLGVLLVGVLVVGLGFALKSPLAEDIIARETPAPVGPIDSKPGLPAAPSFGYLERQILPTDGGLYLRMLTQDPAALTIVVTSENQPVTRIEEPTPRRWHRHDVKVEKGRTLKLQYSIPEGARSYYPPYDWVRIPDTETFNSEGGFAIDPLVKRREALSALAEAARKLGKSGAKKAEVDAAFDSYDGAVADIQDLFSRESLWEGAVFVSPLVEDVLVDLLELRDRSQLHGPMLAAIADAPSEKTRAILLKLPILMEDAGTGDTPLFIDAPSVIAALCRLGDDNARARIRTLLESARAIRPNHPSIGDVLAWSPWFGSLRTWALYQPTIAREAASKWRSQDPVSTAVLLGGSGSGAVAELTKSLAKAPPSERAELLLGLLLSDPAAAKAAVLEGWAQMTDRRTEEFLVGGRLLSFRSDAASGKLLDNLANAALAGEEVYAGDLLIFRGQQAQQDVARVLLAKAGSSKAKGMALRGLNLAMFRSRYGARPSEFPVPDLPDPDAVHGLNDASMTRADLRLAGALARTEVSEGASPPHDPTDPEQAFLAALASLVTSKAAGQAPALRGGKGADRIGPEDWTEVDGLLKEPASALHGAYLVDLATGGVATGLEVHAGDSVTLQSIGVRGIRRKNDLLSTDMSLSLGMNSHRVDLHRRGSRTERALRTDSVTCQVDGPLMIHVQSSDRSWLSLDKYGGRPRSLSRRGIALVFVTVAPRRVEH